MVELESIPLIPLVNDSFGTFHSSGNLGYYLAGADVRGIIEQSPVPSRYAKLIVDQSKLEKRAKALFENKKFLQWSNVVSNILQNFKLL